MYNASAADTSRCRSTVHPTTSIPRVAYKNWRRGTLHSNLPVSAPLANVESYNRNGYISIKFPDEIKTGKRLHKDSLYKFCAVTQHFKLLSIVYSIETQPRLAESKELALPPRLLQQRPELLSRQEFTRCTANPSLSAPPPPTPPFSNGIRDQFLEK